MPRNGRRASSTGCYHVIIRGNNKQDLFRYTKDFEAFRERLLQYRSIHPIQIYHYCFMHNHVHLLVHCDALSLLGAFMHSVQRSYHHYYRKEHTFFGHLTQGRYHSFAVEDDPYLLECGRYIEKNPVRAGLVLKPEDWPYSSYPVYAFGERNDLIDLSPVYLGLGSERGMRELLYRQHVDVTRPYENLLHRRLQRI